MGAKAKTKPLPYQLVALDVDGTLVEPGCGCARPAVQRAVNAVQALGAKVVIASGRCQFAATDARVLGGIRPDYVVCSGGAQLVDADGNELFARTFTSAQAGALLDFCKSRGHELAFSFSDRYDVCIGHEAVQRHYRNLTEHAEFLCDAQSRAGQLEQLPYAAFCHMPHEHVAEFGRLYGRLGLRFVPYGPDWYDICQKDLTKAGGLAVLLKLLGLGAGDMLAAGDAENDIEMLRMAGLGAAMAGAAPAVKAAAGRIAPDVKQDGAAVLLDEVFGLGLGLAPAAGTEQSAAKNAPGTGALLAAAAPRPAQKGAASGAAAAFGGGEEAAP